MISFTERVGQFFQSLRARRDRRNSCRFRMANSARFRPMERSSPTRRSRPTSRPGSAIAAAWRRTSGSSISNSAAPRICTNNDANDSQPMWHGTTLYFLSDRDAAQARQPLGLRHADEAVARRSRTYTDFDVHFPSIGPDEIVFENAGRLYPCSIWPPKSCARSRSRSSPIARRCARGSRGWRRDSQRDQSRRPASACCSRRAAKSLACRPKMA